jgi:hypothetical protein
VVITVLEHVPQPSTYEDGEVIFRLIEPRIRSGENVTLSFAGVSAVPSSFVNSAIVRLVESVPIELIKARLRITDSTKQINDLIRSRLAFVDPSVGHGQVSLGQEWEVVYWSRIFGVEPDRLRDVVRKVGSDAQAIRAYLATGPVNS